MSPNRCSQGWGALLVPLRGSRLLARRGVRRLRHFMKTRRLVTLCALLATLMVSSMSSIAEEGGGGVITVVSGTALGGYVDSSVRWQVQPIHDTPAREYRGWWWKFFQWLGFHGWRLREISVDCQSRWTGYQFRGLLTGRDSAACYQVWRSHDPSKGGNWSRNSFWSGLHRESQ